MLSAKTFILLGLEGALAASMSSISHSHLFSGSHRQNEDSLSTSESTMSESSDSGSSSGGEEPPVPPPTFPLEVNISLKDPFGSLYGIIAAR
jgi:hypothetical protein